ncbi:hypothetical protein O6H91_Y040400 [Diphasiastrum complanatum]|nr:hypothetical protein O6H91_Y040400 [Diphasiastrum complanatum]
MPPTVLMVAEKPSIASSIATFLSSGRAHSRRSFLDVHEFDGTFKGFQVRYKVTSVIGHVLSIDFPSNYQNWDTTDPFSLFQAPTLKSEANPKAHVCKHLQQEGRGSDYLVLWLDCDREGENICFEVMDSVLPMMRKGAGQQVYRARFSAISQKDIVNAMNNLGLPNKNEALAVDARQEIDLKVGVAFTRFQTRYFQGKYGNLDSSVISYGPCQTPTLGFCVERHLQITSFSPEPFWTVRPHLNKAGHLLQLEWERGRLFDREIAAIFQKMVADSQSVKVANIAKKEEVKSRPNGLNTVNMLKVASSGLGIGPHHAMQVAERLYIQGYISYPRTESTAYPQSFDIRGVLSVHAKNPVWGDYVISLLVAGPHHPKAGVDAGDHPPITPMQSATEADLGGGDAWRLYDFVTRHFLASISADCKFTRTKVSFIGGGETFHCTGSTVIQPGFTAVTPWLSVTENNLPPFAIGESIPLSEVEFYQGRTSPPDYLTESELISLMEKHGIGTDASIPVHINNICERNYAQVQAGRRLVPTTLGITLIRGYQSIDVDLCLPEIRQFIEQQITLIGKGQADYAHVVQHALQEFAAKFSYFVSNIERMDVLFEAQFSPLAESGKPLSKCGKCSRYMKYIAIRPTRLYCSTCEEVHSLPQHGSIKLYKELVCPLDNFELVLFSLGGPDGKSYPLCPFCYNHPPFEGAGVLFGAAGKVGEKGSKGGMPCNLCPHPTCRHSMIKQGVCACPECDGTLVLDPISAPKWRLDCNKCSCLVYLPENAHKIVTTTECCEECGSTILEVNFNKNTTPLPNGATLYKACLICDDLLLSLIEVKHGRAFFKKSHRGGRGRGRGRGKGRVATRGRGRGRSRNEDPRMSFRDF